MAYSSSSLLASPWSATTATALTPPGMVRSSAFLCRQRLCLQMNTSAATVACPTTIRRPRIEAKAKAPGSRADRTFRHKRLRKRLKGTPERPRMCVFRSNQHLSVQVIDDSKMHTLASASTMQKPMREEFDYTSGPTLETAKKIGEAIAKSCLEKGITKVVFDRAGFLYHGRIAAVADAAREHGLQF